MKPAIKGLLKLVWRQPLWAIPFALFFGTVFGKGTWSSYRQAYEVSVVFSYVIGLGVWAVEIFLAGPRRGGPGVPRTLPLWGEILSFVAVSILGSFVAAIIVGFLPGFQVMLSSGRAFAMMGMFSLLFAVLVTGIVYAGVFYKQTLERTRSEQELQMARRIQRGFLLSEFPTMPRLEVHAVNVSSREVSGDFYDVVPAGDGSFLLAIADVSGKGVPAALLSSMLQASLRALAPAGRPLAEMMRDINRLVVAGTSPGQFATFFLARVDERTLELSYCNAGHNPPMLFGAGGDQRELTEGGLVVGVMDPTLYEEGRVSLTAGDRLLLYTDGVSEAEGVGGEFYGEERLATCMRRMPPTLNARETIRDVFASVHAFLGDEEPRDDMTVMVLRVDPG